MATAAAPPGDGLPSLLPPSSAWQGEAAVRPSVDGGWVQLPLTSLSGALFNVEVLLGGCDSRHHWLCIAERHDVLPLGLAFGHRLHAEEIADASAPSFLALESFQFRWTPRTGAALPGGVRGALSDARGHLLAYGLCHLRSRKFMCLGRCAAWPGTDVDAIHHLCSSAAGAEGVTLTLADYAGEGELPSDAGFALRWVCQPKNRGIVDREFAYFACSPEGYTGDLSPARFRFVLRP